MLTAVVPVPRGSHRIRVRLSNRWDEATSGPVPVEFRRPPLVERLEASVLPGRPYAAVAARVASLSTLGRVEIDVMSAPTNMASRKVHIPRWERAGDAWDVNAEVPIEPGTNEIVVRCWNEDGPAAESRRTLVYTKPVKPPVVDLESEKQGNFRRPASAVRFRIKSASPLARVELVRERSTAGARSCRGSRPRARRGSRTAASCCWFSMRSSWSPARMP